MRRARVEFLRVTLLPISFNRTLHGLFSMLSQTVLASNGRTGCYQESHENLSLQPILHVFTVLFWFVGFLFPANVFKLYPLNNEVHIPRALS